MHPILNKKINSKIYDIFDSLNHTDIKYCHWKSNSHLDKSFEAESDFDLLIDREDAAKFVNFLHNFNFKQKFSTANYVYPGFEDYLWFDELSGNIFHFHVHYKLIIGKKNQKNYRIPIEKIIALFRLEIFLVIKEIYIAYTLNLSKLLKKIGRFLFILKSYIIG